MNHISDGYALLTKFTISPKKMTIHQKYEESDAVKKANKVGKPVLSEISTKSSTDLTKSRIGRWMTLVSPPKTIQNNKLEHFSLIDWV